VSVWARSTSSSERGAPFDIYVSGTRIEAKLEGFLDILLPSIDGRKAWRLEARGDEIQRSAGNCLTFIM
jgi:hypothetical protein